MKKYKRHLSHSQNFLRDNQLVAKLIDDSSLSSEDEVFEIGPGKGIITRQLARKCAKVIAIEYDRGLYSRLREFFFSNNKVKIILGNFLNFDLPKSGDYKIFSNIPFNLTAEILDKVTSASNPPNDSYLIIQEEAARKYSGKPYGEERFRSLILKIKFEFSIKYRFEQNDFSPVPHVQIVLLRIKRREHSLLNDKDLTTFKDFVAYIYSQSGQDLKERLKLVFTNEQFKRQARENNFHIHSRPGDLKLEKWLALFNYYLEGVSKEKKNLVFDSYQSLLKQQRKLDKIHRTRGIK